MLRRHQVSNREAVVVAVAEDVVHQPSVEKELGGEAEVDGGTQEGKLLHLLSRYSKAHSHAGFQHGVGLTRQSGVIEMGQKLKLVYIL